MKAAIVQARMGSSRLPGKVMAEVSGHPLLWHVVDRTRRAQSLDLVVVATTRSSRDDLVADFCEGVGIRCLRGSEQDVLDRYWQTANVVHADVVVRVTADCPLIDPQVVDRAVVTFEESACDYASNTLKRTYPVGLDVEVFSIGALQRAWEEARLTSEREHVTPYIWKNPDRFACSHVVQEENLSSLRWTVDHPEDLELIHAVYDRLYDEEQLFSTTDILRILSEEPRLARLNSHIQSGEGYLRSVADDSEVG